MSKKNTVRKLLLKSPGMTVAEVQHELEGYEDKLTQNSARSAMHDLSKEGLVKKGWVLTANNEDIHRTIVLIKTRQISRTPEAARKDFISQNKGLDIKDQYELCDFLAGGAYIDESRSSHIIIEKAWIMMGGSNGDIALLIASVGPTGQRTISDFVMKDLRVKIPFIRSTETSFIPYMGKAT